MDDDELDDLISRIPPMSDEERLEELLRYFNAIIKPMDTPTLLLLREHLLRTVRASPDEAIGIELIDGLIALREIRGERRDTNPRGAT